MHTIQQFIQEGIIEVPSQAKLVVSNHHSKGEHGRLLLNNVLHFQQIPLASHSLSSVHNSKEKINSLLSQHTWQRLASSHMLFIQKKINFLGLFPPLGILSSV
jgi:hypothetical protein